MPDEPETPDVPDEDAAEVVWRSRPLAQRDTTKPSTKRESKLTPEQQIEEQKQVESFLRASARAGVTKEELAERLAKAVEHLQKEDDVPDN
jgi:hypothetical protein